MRNFIIILLVIIFNLLNVFTQVNRDDFTSEILKFTSNEQRQKFLDQKADSLISIGEKEQAIELLEIAYNLNINSFSAEKNAELELEIAELSKSMNDNNNALTYYLKALASYSKLFDNQKTAYINASIAEIYYKLKAYENAAEYFQSAEKQYSNVNDLKGETNAIEGLAITYLKSDSLQKSLYNFEKLKRNAKKSNNKKKKLFAMSNIVNIYNTLGNYEKGLSENFEILNYYTQDKDSSNLSEIYNNIGFSYSRLKNYRKALEFYLNAADTDVALFNKVQTATKVNIGLSYYNIGNKDIAFQYLSNTLNESIDDKEFFYSSYIANLLSILYLNENDIYNAKEYSKIALKYANKSKDPNLELKASQTYAKVLNKDGDFQEAMEYQQKSLSIRDSLLLEDRIEKEKRSKIAYELEKMESEIKMILADREIQELAYIKQKVEKEKVENELELLKRNQELQKLELREQELEKQRALQSLSLAKKELDAKQKQQEIEELQKEREIQQLKINQNELKEQERQKEIELLEKDKNLRDLELERANTIRNYLYGLIATFFIIIILSAIAYIMMKRSNRKLAEQKKNIEEANKQLEDKNIEIEAQKDAIVDSYWKLQSTHKKLKEAQSKLVESEKLASLGQLTAGIAHEINNPINFVSGNISPLKQDLEDLKKLLAEYLKLHSNSENIDKQLKAVENLKNELDIEFLFDEIDSLILGITEGASRTKEIVLGLKNFSRLDENDFKLADIHEGLNSTLTLLNNKIKRRITVKKEYDEIPLIECLPGKLNQVFMNILNNSIQAIEDKGEIDIKTKNNDDTILISIKDSGKGMDEKTKEKIFEPFFTTKDVGEGTGLGLSISYGIIEKHNGSMEVISELGNGTEFILTLPKTQKSEL